MVTRQQPFGRSLATAAVWPFGVSLTCWNYLWRTTPLHRRERAGTAEEDTGPALPPGISQEELQPVDAGVGPLFHRRYRVRICDAQLDPEELLERIAADPNAVAPTEFARFTKVHGDKDRMRVSVRGKPSSACRDPGTGRSGSWHSRRRPFASPPCKGTSRRVRSSSEPSPKGICPARSNRGHVVATNFRECSTRTCGWRRRSSCICGRRFSNMPLTSQRAHSGWDRHRDAPCRRRRQRGAPTW